MAMIGPDYNLVTNWTTGERDRRHHDAGQGPEGSRKIHTTGRDVDQFMLCQLA